MRWHLLPFLELLLRDPPPLLQAVDLLLQELFPPLQALDLLLRNPPLLLQAVDFRTAVK